MTGDVITDVFILQPATDVHARSALMHYANSIARENAPLAAYLRAWVQQLYRGDDSKAKLVKPEEFPEWLLHMNEGDKVETVYHNK
jgi:hypothetical protein